MLRTVSTLPPDLDDLIYRTIGVCLAVHRELGPGWPEEAYSRAMRIELSAREMPFTAEHTVAISYRGNIVGHQRIDLLIDKRLVVEIKAVEELHAVHIGQLTNYLRVLKLRAGLLVNFNVPVLKYGIRRIVL